MNTENSKKCKVVILPAEKASKQVLFLNKNNQLLHTHSSSKEVKPNALYILSDEEIKEGDWFIQTDRLQLLRASINFGYDPEDVAKKVIATTDSSLSTKMIGRVPYIEGKPVSYYGSGNAKSVEDLMDFLEEVSLPRPSDSFIKKYCEKYNKGEVIEEVLVEYTLTYGRPICSGCGTYLRTDFCHGCGCTKEEREENYSIKVAPDNTITIHPVVEKTYTGSEVDQLLKKIRYHIDRGISVSEFDKLIEENL